MTRTEDELAAERAGFEIGRRLLDQAMTADGQDDRNRLITAGVVLCAANQDPQATFSGFARAIVPALQGAPENAKSLANLAARAALAGHQASKDADGLITISRWGRSVTFGDIGAASRWLFRVTGDRE